MAFQQGLSGLASASKSIDVTSNNIANTSTVGFKAGTAQFADVYASALTGAVSTIQIGIGSTVNAVKQAFSQGNLTSTNNPLDMGINGNGFFIVQRNDQTVAYSRNGQFDIDKDGFVVTALGERLMGYQSSAPGGGVPTSGGTPVPINIPPGGIDPKRTEDVLVRANLDSRDVNPANLTPPGPAVFDPNNAESYNASTSLRVFDSLGNDHTLTMYFVRTTTTADRSWQVFGVLNGDSATIQELTNYDLVDPTDPSLGVVSPLTFSAEGRMDPNLPPFTFSALLDNGAVTPLNIEVDLSRLTQFGSSFAVTELRQDGYAPGEIAGLAISRDGVIQGRYTNGQTRDLGQVALATFRSPNGLISLGNNLWAESPESGPPIDNKPGSGLNGVITAGQVEDSNVDLTQELVNLIIQQRNYQANAQSIRTQDQILQTLVNLR